MDDPWDSYDPAPEGESGRVDVVRDGDDYTFVWRPKDSNQGQELARYVSGNGLLSVFPKRNLVAGGTAQQFEKIRELQFELPGFDPEAALDVGQRGEVEIDEIPPGFGRIFAYGMGILKPYRGFMAPIEAATDCETVRFVEAGSEGEINGIFVVRLDRFEAYRATVDQNVRRGQTVVRRVNQADAHNTLAPVTGMDEVPVKLGRKPLIVSMTRELIGKPQLDPEDRTALADQTAAESRALATEAPEHFGKLRNEIELVSLEVLVERFTKGLTGGKIHNEPHWQTFFEDNPFALQQLFAAPIAVYGTQLQVRVGNIHGQGARIADFVLANTATRSAFVIEIKTPGAPLLGKPYRGKGGAEAYPPSKDVAGAVAQLQAQVESVRTDMGALINHTSDALELETWAVRGAVIVGNTTSLNNEQMGSFVRYRDGLSAVDVIAFDEVRDRLRVLLEVLTNLDNDVIAEAGSKRP